MICTDIDSSSCAKDCSVLAKSGCLDDYSTEIRRAHYYTEGRATLILRTCKLHFSLFDTNPVLNLLFSSLRGRIMLHLMISM